MLKLHLQGSKNYAIQTQVCTRVTKESSEAELGLMPSLPLAQSPCLVICFSLCPSLCLCLSLPFPSSWRSRAGSSGGETEWKGQTENHND